LPACDARHSQNHEGTGFVEYAVGESGPEARLGSPQACVSRRGEQGCDAGTKPFQAVELARYNIRVNAICPIFSLTLPMTKSGFAEKEDFLASAVPMKHLGAPAETVETLLSLLRPGNSYLTGQAITVDGGVLAL